jgi:hypothetical protein
LKASGISDLQKELKNRPPAKVIELAVRLAKHKKENKELLTYLLFDADDEQTFINSTKEEVDSQFSEMNKSNLYLAKKSLRKILRLINKHIKFSALPVTELELRIHYCKKIRSSGIPFIKSQVLVNLYSNQLVKIDIALNKLHEDLQFDYREEIHKIKL